MRVHRDEGIASVMEKEVFSKHRKAFMLFGHFISCTALAAVLYRFTKEIISTSRLSSVSLVFPVPTFLLCKTVSLSTGQCPLLHVRGAHGWGASDLSHFIPPGNTIDQACQAQ